MTTTVSAIDLAFDEAIAFLRQKTQVTSEHYTDVFGAANVKAFTVAGGTSQALVGDFYKATLKAAESGTSLGEFRRDFDAITARYGWLHNGTPEWRSRIIFETNLSMAYSAGRYAQQTEPETLAAFPFWQYVHSGAMHPRPEHLALNGLVLRADDPFWKTHYPPNGWGCGCKVRPVSARGLARMGKSGPDTAPIIETRPVRTRTGGIIHVPIGIDPGFDYNPGAVWKAEAVTLPPKATLRPPAPIELPKPSPPPAPPEVTSPIAPPAVSPAPSKPPPVPVAAASKAEAQAVDGLLTRDYAGWAKRLKREEVQALRAYKGPAYREFNAQLRGDRSLSYLQPAIEALDAALSRARTARPIRVYRGVTGQTTYGRASVGDIIEEKGFMSTSTNPDTADNFASAHDGIVIEIRLPQDYVGGAYVNRVPDIHHLEYEFLIRPGSRFRVIERSNDRLIVEPVRARRRTPRTA